MVILAIVMCSLFVF
jgi:hypothetical protein